MKDGTYHIGMLLLSALLAAVCAGDAQAEEKGKADTIYLKCKVTDCLYRGLTRETRTDPIFNDCKNFKPYETSSAYSAKIGDEEETFPHGGSVKRGTTKNSFYTISSSKDFSSTWSISRVDGSYFYKQVFNDISETTYSGTCEKDNNPPPPVKNKF